MTNFVITKATTKGFSILLDEPAIKDAKFSWIALDVKDAKTFESDSTTVAPTPLPTSVPILTPLPTLPICIEPIPEATQESNINSP